MPSALVALCVPQPRGATLYRLMREQAQMVVWWGTSVEAFSAFSRLVREGTVTRQGLEPALSRWAALRRAWAEVLPSEQVRSLAETIPERHNLRAGDAFQLAAALIWCQERPTNRPFVCFDLRLGRAAKEVGFSVFSEP